MKSVYNNTSHQSTENDMSILSAKTIKEVQQDLSLYSLSANAVGSSNRPVVITIEGKQYILTGVNANEDGVVGPYINFDAQPISTIL